LFPTILEEPHFYRTKFKRWVQEGMEEVAKMAEINEQTREKVLGSGATPPAPSS